MTDPFHSDPKALGYQWRRPRPLQAEVPAWDSEFLQHSIDVSRKCCFAEHPDGSLVELESSTGIAHLAYLNDELALGERYGYLYNHAGLLREHESIDPQLALWNHQTGRHLIDLNGHFGEILGWQWHDDGTLMTWARDFLIRRWDLTTGAQVAAIPMPLEQDGIPPINVLDSRGFGLILPVHRRAYLNHGRSALTVTHLLINPDGTQTTALGPYRHPSKHHADGQGVHVGSFQELRGEEAVYAESATLADGRLLICPASYGARGCCYLWDQAGELVLLLGSPLLHGIDFHGLEERHPGWLTIRHGDTSESEWRTFQVP